MRNVYKICSPYTRKVEYKGSKRNRELMKKDREKRKILVVLDLKDKKKAKIKRAILNYFQFFPYLIQDRENFIKLIGCQFSAHLNPNTRLVFCYHGENYWDNEDASFIEFIG